MLVYKIRGPHLDLQRGEEHCVIEQKRDDFSLQCAAGSEPSSKQRKQLQALVCQRDVGILERIQQ